MMAQVIDHLWQSTLVALAAALLALALRNHRASVRYWVWLATSMKFLVPFAALVAIGNALEGRVVTIAEPASPSAIDWLALGEQVAQPLTTFVPGMTPVGMSAEPDGRFAIAALVGAVWLAGSAVVLGIWLLRGLRLARLVRAATPLVDRRFGNRGVEIRLSTSRIEPGIVGIFRPVLVLPDGILQRLSDEQLDAVIAHELCHVRRRDNFTATVHMAVAAVFWFHPLVWWIGARLVEERERACDEAVVAAGADPHSYAEGILEVCRLYVESPLPCAAGIGGGATLKSRVRRLAERWAARSLNPAWNAVLAMAALVVLGAPVVIGAVTAPRLLAQPADARVARFDYASIAEANDGDRGRLLMRGAVFEATQPLRPLIAFAYGVQPPQVGGPADIDSRRYRLDATAPGPTVFPAEEFRAMLRTLLAERFGLVIHRETQRMPVLVVGGDPARASRLPVAETPTAAGSIRIQPGSLELASAPLSLLADWLAGAYGKPVVVDETAFRGENDYSFKLEWEPSEAESASPARGAPDRARLARALAEQVGLSLFEADRDVERVVVDRVAEQPIGLWVPPSPGAALQ